MNNAIVLALSAHIKLEVKNINDILGHVQRGA
jgi:hypothetical protein